MSYLMSGICSWPDALRSASRREPDVSFPSMQGGHPHVQSGGLDWKLGVTAGDLHPP
jgi:hypothetical protein